MSIEETSAPANAADFHAEADENLAAEIRGAGFEQVSFERLSLGIVAIHVARKPWTASA